MAHKIVVNAVQINQPGLASGEEVFIASIPVKELIDTTMFKVDQWKKEKAGTEEQGYQRIVNELHAARIANYLENSGAVLPTAIVINSRTGSLKFHDGKLSIINYPLYIVDGQHRISGLRIGIQDKGLDSWKDATMPVVILSSFQKYEEMVQFVDLNTKQKKVETDLALQLMFEMAHGSKNVHEQYIEEGKDWKIRAIKIVNVLNASSKSTWHGQIKIAGEKHEPRHITTSNSFTTSLKPLVRGAFDADRNVNNNVATLITFWNALREIFQDAFLVPKDYAIQKTPGLFSLHELLQAILQKKGLEIGTNTVLMMATLKKVFAEAHIETRFWQSDEPSGVTMYGSMKGFRILADRFKDALARVDHSV